MNHIMFLVFFLIGATYAQFSGLRFDDSFEIDDDSPEDLFRSSRNNRFRSLEDDSREQTFRRTSPFGSNRNRIEIDDDSDEVFFRGTTSTFGNNVNPVRNIPARNPIRNLPVASVRNPTSSFRNPTPALRNPTPRFPLRVVVDDSPEDDSREVIRSNFRGTNNRFDDDDDSDEVRINLRPNAFNRNNNAFSSTSFNRNTNRNVNTFNRNTNRNTNTFNRNSNRNTNRNTNTFNRNSNRNTFGTNNNNRFRVTNNKIDSIEDLFEDLFDNDLDDRVRAQNTLTRLGINPNIQTTGAVTRFNTRLGNQNRFNTNTRTTNNPLLSTSQGSSAFNNNNRFSSNTNNRFGTNTNNRFSTNTNNRFSTNNNNRFSTNNNRFSTNSNRFGSNNNRFSTNTNTGVSLKTNTGSSVPNHFRINQGTNKNSFSFRTPVGSNRLNTNNNNRFGTTNNRFNNNNSANRFSTNNRSNNRVNTASNNRANTGNNNRVNTANRASTKTNSGSTRTVGVPLNSNSIRSDPFSNIKRSDFFPNTPGFNWPGGNGYYVRMSTGNSKPVQYFVKYDD